MAINIVSSCVSLPPWLELNNVLYYAFFFWLGIQIAQYQSKIQRYGASKVKIFAVLVISAVLLRLFWDMDIKYNSVPVVNLVLALCISFLLWTAFQKFLWLGENPYLRYLGRHSLEIYLLHRYFYIICKFILRKIGSANPYWNVFLGFAAGVIGPFAAVWMLKNMEIFKKLDLYEILFRPYYFIIRKTGNHEKISA